MDIYCECGQTTHINADFCYRIKCANCRRVYSCDPHIRLRPLKTEHFTYELTSDASHTSVQFGSPAWIRNTVHAMTFSSVSYESWFESMLDPRTDATSSAAIRTRVRS
jgi:hypothetical protein